MSFHLFGCKARGGGRMVVTPPPAEGGNPDYTNEPAGMTLVAQCLCDQLPTTTSSKPAGWTNFWGRTASTNLSIVADATAPVNGPDVLAIRFPAGLTGGSAPCNFYTGWSSGSDPADIGPCSEIFFAYTFRVVGDGTDYENHAVITKFGFFSGPNSTTGQNDFVFALPGTGTTGAQMTEMNVQLRQQNQWVRNIAQNVDTTKLITVGATWHKLEMHAVTNTLGVDDGTLKIWIDGTLVHDYTDVRWRNETYNRLFCDFKMNPTWGGTGGTKAQTDYIYMSDIYISGKL